MSIADTFEDQVEQEFVDETREVLEKLETVVEQLAGGSAEGQKRFVGLLKDLSALKAAGRYSGQPTLAVTVHRLHDYLAGLVETPTDDEVQDIRTFADILLAVLDGEISHGETDLSEFVRSLPVRRPFDVDDVEHLDIEIMVVEPQKTTAAFVERELHNCGYRVVNVRNALDALGLAVATRPDLVIASATLDELSGIDLACAMAAMPATRDMPFALLTSFASDDPQLKDLPAGVAVLRKGGEFGKDLVAALERFGIT